MGGAMIQAGWKYLRWYLSPQPSPSPSLKAVKKLYHRLAQARNFEISIELFGARSQALGQSESFSLAELLQRSASPPWKGALLYSLVRRSSPRYALELGTHMGFGTLYIAAAAPTVEIHTIEASIGLAKIAQRHFRLLGVKPHLHIGLFEDILPRLPAPWDFVYIDGDHRGEALRTYGLFLYERLAPSGQIVCDDIFWSIDMYRGWKELVRMTQGRAEIVGPFGILYK
ncbi:MAG: class I SAM-dependent methyltransferase [Bacteroidia bacterium]|nr:class I SAM-dependent methyltransferase [Bacteroidia bacterium]MDW8015420.1 class I SAM-dependent methyltransferase [Bacteroidia bacterium]